MIIQASVAMSVDGYIDDRTAERLVLSHPADWEEVRRLRSQCDAVLIGAETLRRDNPALVTRSETLRRERLLQGKPADPVKATVSRNGNLDPESRFFREGSSEKIVIVGSDASRQNVEALSRVASVIRMPSAVITAADITDALRQRGIGRLFIEGGSRILTLFLTEDRIDYLRVAIAPFFVGDPSAVRMTTEGRFPFDKNRRMEVLRVERVGDMTVTDYALSHAAADYARILETIRLAENCPRSETAYSVGAVLVTKDRRVFSGYSRETAPGNHAEEEVILKAEQAGALLEGATIYSSMEPCSTRKSKPCSCSALIINRRMERVVFAAHEPDHFVDCRGERLLRDAGIGVSVVEPLSDAALRVNAHILFKEPK